MECSAEAPTRSAPQRARITTLLLIGIVTTGGVLRIAGLTHAPPGLNQDEAANGWNAWCLLKTGRDQVGTPWPTFYAHALGENRSTLFLYALLPFQALAGLNVWTCRLPSAVSGTLTVFLIYWIGAQLFSRPVGLVAAAVLALSPWHIETTRLGLEGALAPFLVTLPLAAWLWAGFPLQDREARPRWWRALLAGLITGGACYGYFAVRLFVPVFFALCVLASGRAWLGLLQRRAGQAAVVALASTVGLTFGPLAYKHLAEPELISKRAARIWLWQDRDPPLQRVTKVLQRYAAHFGPDFLFISGDHLELQSARGFGALSWYALPLLAAGVGCVLHGARRSRATRVALLWLLLYPLGDCFHVHLPFTAPNGAEISGMHVFRSAPGLTGLALLAALGAVGLWRWAWPRARAVATRAGLIFVLIALALDGRFLHYYFGEHCRRPPIWRAFYVDLVQACDWLRPRFDQVDAVFMTRTALNMPYPVALVALGYKPEWWFAEPREFVVIDGWEHCTRFGKVRFMYDSAVVQAAIAGLQHDGYPERVIFIVRPGEIALRDPLYTVSSPDGKPSMLVYETAL